MLLIRTHLENYMYNSLQNSFCCITISQMKISPLSYNKNTYSLAPAMIASKMANLQAGSLVSTMAKSVNGLKPATFGSNTPLAFGSVHVGNLNLLNFSDISTPNILDSINPSDKIGVLKALPNQLKSLVLNAHPTMVVKAAFATDDTAPGPTIFAPQNLSLTYHLFKNIAQIEYLDNFTLPVLPVPGPGGKTKKVLGARPLLKSPRWKLLNESSINSLEDKTTSRMTVLCRIVRYVNKDLGIGFRSKLDLPIIDKYFILAVEPRVAEKIDFSFDWGQWVYPTLYAGGSTDEVGVETDMGSLQMEDLGRGRFWRMLDPERPQDEITVRQFDGVVVIGQCDEGSADTGGPG